MNSSPSCAPHPYNSYRQWHPVRRSAEEPLWSDGRWRGHPFDRTCQSPGIEHRLTKLNHPWTNGQVERMNRTIKEATVKRYHYDSHEQLRRHLAGFLAAYNFARRLKTLGGLTPTNTSASLDFRT